jgi:hypothetical protein
MNVVYWIKRLTIYAYAIGQIRAIIHEDNPVDIIRTRVQKVIDEMEEELEHAT